MSQRHARASGVQSRHWFHRFQVFQSFGSLNTTKSKSGSSQLSQYHGPTAAARDGGTARREYHISIADARGGGSSLADSGGHAQPQTNVEPQAFQAFTPLPCFFGFFFFFADHASLLLSYIPEASVRSSAGAMVFALVEELYHA